MQLNVFRVVRHPKTPHSADLLPNSGPWNGVACCTGLWVVLDWKPHQPELPRTRIDGQSAWALTSMDNIAHIGRTACPTLQCCCTCHQCRQPAHFRNVTCRNGGVHLRLSGMHPLRDFFVRVRDEILSQETSSLQWTLLNLLLHPLGESVSFCLQLLNMLVADETPLREELGGWTGTSVACVLNLCNRFSASAMPRTSVSFARSASSNGFCDSHVVFLEAFLNPRDVLLRGNYLLIDRRHHHLSLGVGQSSLERFHLFRVFELKR